jgi:hypothetical protein
LSLNMCYSSRSLEHSRAGTINIQYGLALI